MQTQIPARFFQMLQEVWGFSKLRESQVQAVAAPLAGHDALVVVPTGGGKSLCYQAPAVFRGGVTIVISPLIALMKDQVDSLKQLGIPAARWDSSLTPSEKRFISSELNEQKIRLLFASPERAVQKDFPDLFRGNTVHSIAIDEAHCVSQWGHDFRPEYRNLLNLRNAFPNASMMALTATATEQVQHDIVNQLQLRNPSISVHSFDRPNLT
ncbi:MAG: helicase RecQ, partial [Planctomycetota bacterium]